MSALWQSDPSSGRPLTDEEQKANFTAEEKEFLKWTEENHDYLLGVYVNGGSAAEIDFMRRRWVEDFDKYYAWSHTWTRRHHRRIDYKWKPKDFVNLVTKTNYLHDLPDFLEAMGTMKMPFTILGEAYASGVLTGFALSPNRGTELLWPNYDSPDSAARGLASRAVLGINLNVRIQNGTQPRAPGSHGPIGIEYSGLFKVRPATEQDVQSESGFSFVQIGSLCIFDKDWTDVRSSHITPEIVRGPWITTRFAVVVRLDSSGRPGEVYVLYNFHRGFPGDGPVAFHFSREHEKVVGEDGNCVPHVGRLRRSLSGQKFAMAHIADSLDQLVDGEKIRPFQFKVVSHSELQLVRVKTIRTQDGEALIRQYVSDSPMPGEFGGQKKSGLEESCSALSI